MPVHIAQGSSRLEIRTGSRGCRRDRERCPRWTQILARYRQPSTGRSLVEIAIDRAARRALGAGLGNARHRLLLALPLAIAAAGFSCGFRHPA